MMAPFPPKRHKVDTSHYNMCFKVLAKPKAAVRILGVRGANVAELRQLYNIGVHIQLPDNCFPRTDMQVVVLLGGCDQIAASLGYVLPKLLEVEQMENPGQSRLTLCAAMTQNAVSMVIGNSGATVKELREASNCNIFAEREGFLGEQLVKVTGAAEDIPKAFALLVPFAERSGDSIPLAIQEYGMFSGQLAVQSHAGHGCFGNRAILTARVPPQIDGRAAIPGVWAPPQIDGRAARGGWGGCRGGGGKGRGLLASGGGGRSGPYDNQALPPPRVVTPDELLGAEGDELAAAGEASEDFVQEPFPEELDPMVQDSSSSISFPVPLESIGRLFQEAAVIKKAASVKLAIEPGDGEGTVTLTGTLRAVHRAHCLVIGRLQAY